MESDLDKKLKQVIGSIESAARDYERGGEISVLAEIENQALEDIQLVFKEAGYIRPSPRDSLNGYAYVKNSELIKLKTGKEWYNRFEKEWGEWPEEDCCNPGSSCEDQVRIDMRRAGLETARLAAGIEEAS